MNMQDLEYLRDMAQRSETEDFSNDQIKKISEALRTNVYANDTTEALDLTAQIIENQDMRADRDKLHDLTKEVIYYGNLLGAERAIDKVDYFDFEMEVKKEHVTIENVNRESNGNSFLEASIYASKSPETVKAIIEKGGEFAAWEAPEDISYMLLNRLTSDYDNQVKEYGENSIKNNLGNLAVLIETGLIEKTKDLDRLISNPELFEKYPEMMNKLFGEDKELPNKLEKAKNREKLKEQHDYLADKLATVRAAVRGTKSRRRISENQALGISRGDMLHEAKVGKTGDSNSGEVDKIHRRVADIQENAAKEIMKQHRENADR